MTQRNCPQCNIVLHGNPKFCPECGAPLQGQKPARGDTPAGKSSAKSLRDGMIIVGFLALVSAGYFIFRDAPAAPQRPAQQQPAPSQNASQSQKMAHDAEILNQLPKDYNTLVGMGNSFMDQQDYALAAEIYRRALAIDSSSADVRTDYGACLHSMGLDDRALEEFTRVLKEHPEHAIANFNKGIVFSGLGNRDSARFYWEKYLSIEPNGRAAAAAKQYLQRMGE